MLLDWILPGVAGLAALEVMRDRGFNWPVIMITGRDAAVPGKQTFVLEEKHVLAKPFDPESWWMSSIACGRRLCPQSKNGAEAAGGPHRRRRAPVQPSG